MLTTKLLADSTGTSSPVVAPSPAQKSTGHGGVWGRGGPAARQGLEVAESPVGMNLGDNPEILGDITLEGLEAPPEPSEAFQERYQAASAPAKTTPLPSVFPGAKMGGKMNLQCCLLLQSLGVGS